MTAIDINCTFCSLFMFFNEYPVFPTLNLVSNILAFIPIAGLIYIAHIAPLHDNCRYILCVWAMSYGALYIIQILFAMLDFENETGYMPLIMFEPHLRFRLYEWHVRTTSYSSFFEIALSIERMVAVIEPRRYHFSTLAWKKLVALTFLLIGVSYAVDSFVHSADHFLSGCALLFIIEISVVVAGLGAAKVCSTRYMKIYGKSSLTERYQVKEAHEMSKAMIPAYIISFFLKSSTIILLYAYFAVRDNHAYLISYLQAYYYTIYTFNGCFALVILLLKHPQLRKQTRRKFRALLGMTTTEKVSSASVKEDTETYFSMLTTDWK